MKREKNKSADERSPEEKQREQYENGQEYARARRQELGIAEEEPKMVFRSRLPKQS